MKNIYKIFGTLLAVVMLHGCGNDFLDTSYSKGVDRDGALDNVKNIETATNGIYYRLFHYAFLGNYALTIGDVTGDMATFNYATTHWSMVFDYTVIPTTPYLGDIWNYGYKVVDASARVIEAANALMAGAEEDDRERLQYCIAQASALKGLALLYLTNIYGLPIKTNGTDNGSSLGVVAIEGPVGPEQQVSRSTVAQCYERIVADFERAIGIFEELGDNGDPNNVGLAATEGLLARTLLYMEDWNGAKEHAQNALDIFGGGMIYDSADYRAMYGSVGANSETIFKLAIDSSDNWSANSCGTLWTTYGYSPSFAYKNLLAETDIRAMFLEGEVDDYGDFYSFGAKFSGENGNPAVSSNFLVRIPEMYLIIAESELKSDSGSIENAQAALLNVAKRNSAITSTVDLPADKAGLTAFLEDERARELFQEGFRFQDLRRWGKLTGVSAYGDEFDYVDFDIAKFCFPIPDTEIRSGFGVEQTPNWADNLPE